jgi:segregation and condensation protein B
MELSLAQKIEALLFYKGEPMTTKALAKLMGERVDSVSAALDELRASLAGRGIVLLEKDDSFTLGTTPAMSEMIESMRKEELSKDLGKAALETLSIILYKGPIARSEIDWIRGVNSSFIIRNLMVRGLVEKIQNPEDTRSFLYRPTFDLLGNLGISHIEELPKYTEVRQRLEHFIEEQDLEGAEENNP